ncbi:MAG: tetratricopeptide repeat protein, partial [Planctomycetota bacterium]
MTFCLVTPRTSWADAVDDAIAAGTKKFQAQKYFEAIQSFETALERATTEARRETVRANLASAYGALGAEYFEAGESSRAEEMFRKGLSYAENYYSHFGLGFLYFQRMEDAKALQHLQSSLDHRDDFAGTHKLLGLLDYRKGNFAPAIEKLRIAKRLDGADKETAMLIESWVKELALTKSFRRETGKRFVFRIDPKLKPAAVRAAKDELQSAYREISKALGARSDEPVVVALYRDTTFYKATGSSHYVGGLYDGQLKLPVHSKASLKPGTPGRAKFRETVRHEVTHVVVRRLAPECPVWLNEGIAQYFEVRRERSGERRK